MTINEVLGWGSDGKVCVGGSLSRKNLKVDLEATVHLFALRERKEFNEQYSFSNLLTGGWD